MDVQHKPGITGSPAGNDNGRTGNGDRRNKEMTLGELFKIMDNPDLIRVKRGGEVLYAGFLGMVENDTLDGYDFKKVNAPEDAEIKKIKAVPELRHRNYKALELEPPLNPDIAPKYKFSDLQMQLYYDIYI